MKASGDMDVPRSTMAASGISTTRQSRLKATPKVMPNPGIAERRRQMKALSVVAPAMYACPLYADPKGATSKRPSVPA